MIIIIAHIYLKISCSEKYDPYNLICYAMYTISLHIIRIFRVIFDMDLLYYVWVK